MMKQLTRVCVLVGLVGCAACRTTTVRGVALSPHPSSAPDSAALAITAEVAVEHGLTRDERLSRSRDWIECFTGRRLSICSQRVEKELQFLLMYSGSHWSSDADTVEAGLVRSLRATYGESVRQCEPRFLTRDLYGCDLVAKQDSM